MEQTGNRLLQVFPSYDVYPRSREGTAQTAAQSTAQGPRGQAGSQRYRKELHLGGMCC